MTPLDTVPLWLAIPVAVFLTLGATLALIGAWGLLRLHSFYDRLHAPTLATSWGTGGVILASALLASHFNARPILHELIIGLGALITVPVTLMLLGRAALHRDRFEKSAAIPEQFRQTPTRPAKKATVVKSEAVEPPSSEPM